MDRRFSDAEVAEILSAAAQREEGGGKEGWTSDQVLAMAAELGIDPESVRAEMVRSRPAVEPAGGTTELIPGRFPGVGAPKGLHFRRRMRGALPEHALDDVAEDARRSFTKLKRLERRPDELIVEGTFYDADATVFVEVGPKYSSIEFRLDFGRLARVVHIVWQIVGFMFTMYVWTSSHTTGGPWVFIPLLIFSAFAYLLSLLTVGIACRRTVARAEKAFELQSNRAARMLYATHPELAAESDAAHEQAKLQTRLRSQT